MKLVEVNEENWMEAVTLSVTEEQQEYLDWPIGIIARGYIYRECNAKVLGVVHEERMIGLALVKDMDEEPACYDLQQFMIDQNFQNRGYGTEALQLILSELSQEGKYDCAEVCVKKEDAVALRVYEKAGFKDTGYIDEDAPDCLNLMCFFDELEQ